MILYDSKKDVPHGPFDIISEDPPWWFENWGKEEQESRGEKWGRAKARPVYKCMTREDLCATYVSKLVKRDAARLTWVTFPKLYDSMEYLYNEKYRVRHTRGKLAGTESEKPVFEFRAVPFVWIKTNKRAYDRFLKEFGSRDTIATEDSLAAIWSYIFEELIPFFKGSGYYVRGNVEICLLSIKGSGLPRYDTSQCQLIYTPLGGHSEKPYAKYAEKIHRLFGADARVIELYARKQNPPPDHWRATGLDYDGLSIEEFLAAK